MHHKLYSVARTYISFQALMDVVGHVKLVLFDRFPSISHKFLTNSQSSRSQSSLKSSETIISFPVVQDSMCVNDLKPAFMHSSRLICMQRLRSNPRFHGVYIDSSIVKVKTLWTSLYLCAYFRGVDFKNCIKNLKLAQWNELALNLVRDLILLKPLHPWWISLHTRHKPQSAKS